LQAIESTPGLYASLLREVEEEEDDEEEVNEDKKRKEKTANSLFHDSQRSHPNSSSAYLSRLLNQSMVDNLCAGLLRAAEQSEHSSHQEEIEKINPQNMNVNNIDLTSSGGSSASAANVESGESSDETSSSNDSIVNMLRCNESLNRVQLSHLIGQRNELFHPDVFLSSPPPSSSWENDTPAVSAVVSGDGDEGAKLMQQHLRLLQHFSVALRKITTSLTDRRGGIPPYR
jgi:hypothetical protein